MSRSAEEQLLLEQRIEAMKRKNEELKRRHLEVEADKQSAAKQNALVQIKSPFDDEWIPGGRHERVEERNAPQPSPSSQDQSQSTEHQRGPKNEGRDEGHICHDTITMPKDEPGRYPNEASQFRGKRTPNQSSRFIRGRRSDNQNFRSNSGEWSEENRRTGDRTGYSNNDGPRNQYKDWGGDRAGHLNSDSPRNHYKERPGHDSPRNLKDKGGENRQWTNQPRRDEAHVNDKEFSQNSSSVPVASKVFKNSAIEGDKGRKQIYKTTSADGPPLNLPFSPQFTSPFSPPFNAPSNLPFNPSFNSPEGVERQHGPSVRRNFSRGQGHGRGGRSWNSKRYGDTRELSEGDHGDSPGPRSGESYEVWRRERNKIDQDRINRQKTSDGNWSREWDSNKVHHDGHDRPHAGGGSRGYNKQHHGGRVTTENTGGVAHARMRQMREGNFPVPGWNDGAVSQTPPCHEPQIRRGRFGPRGGRGRMVDHPSSHQDKNKAQEPVVDVRLQDSDSEVKNIEEDKQNIPSCSDGSGTSVQRSVTGVNGSLKINVINTNDSTIGRNVTNANDSTIENSPAQKRHRIKTKRERNNRVSSKTSSATPEPKEDEDGSWEDVSSEEENVSEISEIKPRKAENFSSKPVDVSSGPESLDPIPSTGKEDGFLWDEYHTSGFQDNLAMDVNAEEVYKALLDKKSNEGDDGGDVCPPCPTFKLDTLCLEDSDGEDLDAKLDPLLVTTRIVQAEVDKMSLPSYVNDNSLPDEILHCLKGKVVPENEAESYPDVSTQHNPYISAEELSGPVSILEIHSPQSVSSESEVSFQTVESPDTPKKELVEENDQIKKPVDASKNHVSLKDEDPLSPEVDPINLQEKSENVTPNCSVPEVDPNQKISERAASTGSGEIAFEKSNFSDPSTADLTSKSCVVIKSSTDPQVSDEFDPSHSEFSNIQHTNGPVTVPDSSSTLAAETSEESVAVCKDAQVPDVLSEDSSVKALNNQKCDITQPEKELYPEAGPEQTSLPETGLISQSSPEQESQPEKELISEAVPEQTSKLEKEVILEAGLERTSQPEKTNSEAGPAVPGKESEELCVKHTQSAAPLAQIETDNM